MSDLRKPPSLLQISKDRHTPLAPSSSRHNSKGLLTTYKGSSHMPPLPINKQKWCVGGGGVRAMHILYSARVKGRATLYKNL